MAWEDALQDASFREVKFQVLQIEDVGGHEVARHSFPYRDGQETEDLGLRAWEIRISGIFWGDDYERELDALIDALEEEGPGELIHPVYGSLNVQALDWRVRHQADGIDQCWVDISFTETDEPGLIFQQLNPRQSATALTDSDSAVTAAATEAYLADIAQPSLRSQLAAVRAVLNGTISEIYGQARGVVHSALDVINYPRIMASDIIQGVAAILALPESLNPDKIFSQWRSVAADAKNLHLIPATISGQQSRPPSALALRPVQRLVTATVVSQYAATVGELFAAEAENATLTPEQIETMVGDVRTMIESVIVDLRTDADLATADKLERYRPVIEALKDQALLLQNAAQALIELRPPLIQRTVTSDVSLYLIAHQWYSDYSRADELLRLNPQIRQPNFVLAGTVLWAYAE